MQIADDVIAAPPLSWQSLRDAERAAKFAVAHVADWEALSDHQLGALAPRIEELARLLTMSNRVEGLASADVVKVQDAWTGLWGEPVRRLFALRDRVRRAVGFTATQAAVSATKEMLTFADFEALLGLPRTGDYGDANLRVVADTWRQRIAEWGSLNPLKLIDHEPAIFGIASWLDLATMFSPVAIDYLNDRPYGDPITWQEKVMVAIPLGEYQRFAELSGLLARALMAQEVIGTANVSAGRARWSRLDPVKQWAFEQRRADPNAKRPAVIRRITDQVRAMARDAGEPLSGDDHQVRRTITGWFVKAGIK